MFHCHSGFQLQDDVGSKDTLLMGSSKTFAPVDRDSFRLSLKSRAAPFASISSSLFQSLGNPGVSNGSRTEPHTGLEFPSSLCHKSRPCPELAGLGVRSKRILGLKNINIYALGIYVDPAAAKRALSGKFKSATTAEDLAKDQALFDEVVNSSSFEKSLRLVISFNSLKRAQFVDALEERLAPRLKQAGEDALMHAFSKQFDDVAFHKGLEISFVQEGSKLITTVAGKEMGTISSPALCRSLFDIYLGKDAVSPDAKSTFGLNLAASLKQ